MFAFAHTALHGIAGRGGVYVRGLPGLFYLDLSINGVHVGHDKGPCENLQLFLTGFSAFIFVIHYRIHHDFYFLRNALLTCVHLKFSSC